MGQSERVSSTSPGSARGRERRRQIVEAAERIFGEAGYWGATTAQIARQVGISQPALYRYFRSKRELFLEAISLRQYEIESVVREALGRPGSALDKLRSIGQSTIELALARPHMAMLRIQAVALAAQDDEIGRSVRYGLDRLIAGHETLVNQARAEGSLAAGVDARAVAVSLAGQAFLLYVTITAHHPLANAQDAAAGFEGLIGLLEPAPG